MKKIITLSLVLLLVFSLIGCGRGRANLARNRGAQEPEQNTNTTGSRSITQIPEGFGNEEEQSWPTGIIYEVPEWIGIIRYYGGGKSLDEYADRGRYSMSVIALEESLERYLDTLEKAGFVISDYGAGSLNRECIAERGLVRLEITSRRFGSERGYQVEFELQEIGTWPRYNLPAFLFPITGKLLVNNPVIYQPGQDLRDVYGVWVDDTGYNFQFTYTGLSMVQAVVHMNDLASRLINGSYFSESILEYGGFGFIKGNCYWEDEYYYVYGEVVQQDPSTYNFYIGWAREDQGW